MLTLLFLLSLDEFHVSPTGNDANDGKGADRAWRTVAKVNAAALKPGDRVLFARGGEWRESLKAPSSGAPGNPIVFAAYGSGARPRFVGSDVLPAAEFKAASGQWEIPVATRVASVLADGEFLAPGAWSWKAGVLRIASTSDPRSDGKRRTACVRVDPVHSNGKDHLVFKDLVADESADERDGYGFRVMGSRGVRIEDCEAYRAGRHHFGVINSTEFVGLRLLAARAMPACPGGATFYVSFSDASRKGDVHQWIDCAGERFENPGGGNYQVFYNHGEGLGPLLIRNLTSKGGQFTAASSKECRLTIEGGRLEDHSLVIYGDHARVDGLAIVGNGAVDAWCADSVFENLDLALKPKGGGPTGYGAALLFRDGAKRNLVRFCTARVEGGSALKVLAPGSAKVSASALLGGVDGPADLDRNHYGASPVPKTDARGLTGDPKLGTDGRPLPGSPLIGAVDGDRPAKDRDGKPRPSPASIGAFEP